MSLSGRLATILSLACALWPSGGCTTSPSSHVERVLQERYGEPFQVSSSEYVFGTDSYNLLAAPKARPDETFMVHLPRSRKAVSDFYPESQWNRQAQTRVQRELDRVGGPKAVTQVAVHSEFEPDPRAIPTFEQLQARHASSVSMLLQLHVFGPASVEALAGPLSIDADLRRRGFKAVALRISFYAQEIPVDLDATDSEHFLGRVSYRFSDRTASPDPELVLSGVSADPRALMNIREW